MLRSRLYIKIFFTYLFILIITEIMIFGLFRYVAGNALQREFREHFESTSGSFVKILEESLKTDWDNGIGYTKKTGRLLNNLAEIFQAKIWVENSKNNIILKSFTGGIPSLPEKEIITKGNIRFLHRIGKDRLIYARLQINLPNRQKGYVHFFHTRERKSFDEKLFLLGLAAIGIVIAILLYPLARYITGPLKELTRSAISLSMGDFHRHVKIKGNDEITRLAESFNIMTEKISRMVTGTKELTANISHELRSPLARIRVALEILSNDISDHKYPECRNKIKLIESEIEDMNGLIEQILTLSKLDIKKKAGGKSLLDPVQLIKDIIQRFHHLLDKKSLRVNINSSEKALYIQAIDEDIKILLTNLIDNAIKFSPDKSPININIEKDANRIIIRVFNRCEDILKDKLGKIFEPFIRTVDQEFPGSGLGLAIVRKIAAQHKGSIQADLKDNGIEMILTLPLSIETSA